MADNIAAIPFDDALILVRGGHEIIVLNEAARLIWQATTRGSTPADAAVRLVERYGLSRERAESDVDAALAEWQARGLIAGGPAEPCSEFPIPAPTTPISNAPPPADVESVHVYALCGQPVCFRFRDRDVESLIHPLLSTSEVFGRVAQETIDLCRDGADHVIAVDGAEIGRSFSAEEVLGLALGHVLEVSYPNARWLAMFHAGVVADDHLAIVLPGTSGSGKSTLTAALVHAGLRYLSDDVAPLDGRTLHVVPVPFAASLKQGSWPVLAPWFPDLERLRVWGHDWRQRRYLDLSRKDGGARCSGVPVKALVFPKYRSSGPTRMQRIRPSQALERLLQAGGWISLDQRDLAMMLDWLMATTSYEIDYIFTEDASKMITDLCSMNAPSVGMRVPAVQAQTDMRRQ